MSSKALPEDYRLEHRAMYWLLQDQVIASALVHIVTGRNLGDFEVEAYPHSILLSSADVKIAIIIYSGFELHEYVELRQEPNLRLVTVYPIILEMVEFKEMDIVLIKPIFWLLTLILRSNRTYYDGYLSAQNLRALWKVLK